MYIIQVSKIQQVYNSYDDPIYVSHCLAYANINILVLFDIQDQGHGFDGGQSWTLWLTLATFV